MSVPPPYCYRKPTTTGKQERPSPSPLEPERDLSSQIKQVSQCGIASKFVAPDIAINIDPNPYFRTRSNKVEHAEDRIAIDTNLLQSKAQYGGIGAASAAAAHRKVGTVQYGITRMY